MAMSWSAAAGSGKRLTSYLADWLTRSYLIRSYLINRFRKGAASAAPFRVA
jgi:hypothetical protein